MNVKSNALLVSAVMLVGSTIALCGVSANADETESVSYTATLSGTVGSYSFWDAGDVPTTDITGNGSYSITFALDEGATESVAGSTILILETDINPYDYVEDTTGLTASEVIKASGITLSVDSVLVDDKAVEYNYSDGALCMGDTGKNLRLNICNPWASPSVSDIDGNFTVNESITINFSVAGLEVDKEEEEVSESASESVSESVSASESTSASASESVSASESTSASGSESVSASESVSVSASEEVSVTTIASEEVSGSESVSGSGSVTTEVSSEGSDTTTEASTSVTTVSDAETTEATSETGYHFDVNNDGQINVIDLMILKKKLLGMEV